MKSYIRYRQEGFIALATITSLLILALYETQQIHNTILKQSLGLLVLGAIAMEFIIGVKLITKEVKVTVSDTAIKIDVKKYYNNNKKILLKNIYIFFKFLIFLFFTNKVFLCLGMRGCTYQKIKQINNYFFCIFFVLFLFMIFFWVCSELWFWQY